MKWNLGHEFNFKHGFHLSDRKIRLIYTFYVPKMRLVLGTRELNVLWNWKIFGFFIRRKILRPLIRSRVKSSSFNDISMNGISRFLEVIWGQTIRRSRETEWKLKSWMIRNESFSDEHRRSRDQYTKHHTYSRLRRSINAAKVIRGHLRSNELSLMIIQKETFTF